MCLLGLPWLITLISRGHKSNPSSESTASNASATIPSVHIDWCATNATRLYLGAFAAFYLQQQPALEAPSSEPTESNKDVKQESLQRVDR
jgi:hypothetical protein